MAHPIDTVGFRPPQFSEDLAWVPGWLQQHQIEQLDACDKKLKGADVELDCKAVKVPTGKNSQGNCADILSREEDRNKSYHLFLSGEDSTPADFASSPGNFLHFHLRLSSTGFSHCSPTQPPEPIDTSVSPKVGNCSEMEHKTGGRNVLPLSIIQKSMEDVGPQSPCNEKISATYIRDKYNIKYLKATDMTAAAELSIAASEALVIHEILRHGTVTDAMPTEMVIEAALRVKKARLKWSVDALDSLADETDESDSLSDLDDLTMSDVYEDVGLSHCIPFDDCTCCSAVSLVKETPLSEKEHDCVNLCDPVELGAQQIKSDDMSAQGQLSEKLVMDGLEENVPAKYFNHEREEFYDNLVSGSNICSAARYNDSVPKNSNVLIKKQKIGQSMVDVTSYQPENGLNIHPYALNSANAGEDKISDLVPDWFRSQWLGGWTGQEVSAVGDIVHNTKSIVSCFAAETSFLSESADIAPDINSVVQVESHRMSQSSVQFDHFHSESIKGILLSQDVVRSSSLSSVDPLCSVVPCSIPSENEVPIVAQTHRDKGHTKKCSSPTTELGVWNLNRPSNLGIKVHHEIGQATPAIDGEDSPDTVQQQFISLKTYSTLLPNSVYNGGTLYQSIKLDCAQRLITLDQKVGCIRSSYSCGKSTLPFKHISEHLSSRDNTEYGKLISNETPDRRNYIETTGDGNELPVQASKNRRHFASFKHMAHCHLRAPKSLLNNSSGEKHSKLNLLVDNVVEPEQNKKLESIPSERKSIHGKDVPAKKRVHFSEAEIAVQKMKNPKISTKSWLTDRSSKKPKFTSYSKFQNHEKCWRTSSHVKAEKKLLFHGIQFLLTGFSRQKEKDLEGQIWKHGGIVLFNIPSPNPRANRSLRSNSCQLPIILCSKKLQTTKFLYGCAVNAFLLKDDWLTKSISADHMLPPQQYIILRNVAAAEHISIGKPFSYRRDYVFDRVGIMLHGKQSFCSKFAKIIKHGGGQVFKTLQRLMLGLGKEKISWGAIVSDDKKTSRHLRHCAAEQRIPIMPASWIIKSLHLGKCLPFADTGNSSSSVLMISGPTFLRMNEDV